MIPNYIDGTEYVHRQFQRLGDTNAPYDITLVIKTSHGATNHLNITQEQLHEIQKILLEGEKHDND